MYILTIYGLDGDFLEERKGDNLDALQRLGKVIVDQGLYGWIPVLKVAIFEGDRIIWRFRSGETQEPVADTDEGEGNVYLGDLRKVWERA